MSEEVEPIKDTQTPADDNRAEWHQKRRDGIGGSDVSSLLGLSKWTSPGELYALKLGLRKPSPSGPAAERGTRLEPDIVRLFAERTGMPVGPGVEFLRHAAFPRIPIQANTDGTILLAEPGVFEAKTAGDTTQNADFFRHHRIPTNYAIQIQTYLAATGMQWGAIAGMVGPRDSYDWDPEACEFFMLRFTRNNEAIALIEKACEEFWKCVVEQQPPTWYRHPLANDVVVSVNRKAPEIIQPMY